MRTYRVIGQATYLDRSGSVQRINVQLTTEAPDAETAKTLILGKIDIRAGACAAYDPQARWDAAWNVVVEDVTAEQEATEAAGVTVGAHVLRKGGGSAKRGADARIGIIKHIYVVRKNGEILVKCSVDWPAPNRIGGDGWRRSVVLASAIIPATEGEIERRRELNRARNARLEKANRTSHALPRPPQHSHPCLYGRGGRLGRAKRRHCPPEVLCASGSARTGREGAGMSEDEPITEEDLRRSLDARHLIWLADQHRIDRLKVALGNLLLESIHYRDTGVGAEHLTAAIEHAKAALADTPPARDGG